MSSEAPWNAALDGEGPTRPSAAMYRMRLLIALLIASAFVPTLIAIAAGTASLDHHNPALPPLLMGPPDHPIVVQGPQRREPSNAGSPLAPSAATDQRRPAQRAPARKASNTGRRPTPGTTPTTRPTRCPGSTNQCGTSGETPYLSPTPTPGGTHPSGDPTTGPDVTTPHTSPSPSGSASPEASPSPSPSVSASPEPAVSPTP